MHSYGSNDDAEGLMTRDSFLVHCFIVGAVFSRRQIEKTWKDRLLGNELLSEESQSQATRDIVPSFLPLIVLTRH